MQEKPHTDLHRELEYRLRQQALISELGLHALRNPDFDALFDKVARLAAEGLAANFSKVLQYLPSENRLLVRAGVGWTDGVVGAATIDADLESPGGYALHTGEPVISNHLAHEGRFRTPKLLSEHGVKRAINVIIPNGDGKPFGVLEVDSPVEGSFTEHDISFLQAAANVLGAVIERQRAAMALETAVREKEMLMREAHHRIKNSLNMVSSMINLQSRDLADPQASRYLAETSARVIMVARVHERLYQGSGAATVEFGQYLRDLCQDLLSMPGIEGARLALDIETADLELARDKVVLLALIVNELVTNAVKYASSESADDSVEVLARRTPDGLLEITVQDNGPGLPEGFAPAKSSGLGMKLVAALTSQLEGRLDFGPNARTGRGARFTLLVPL